jgi:hypothetical protein
MGPEAILLSVRQNGREGSYRFTCPSCEDDVEKRADRKIFDEPVEDPRGPLPTGPAFSIDDVIEFHYLLEDERYIEEFLASSGGA